MTKEEKIKEAYREDYERIKYYIDGDGWLDGRPCDNELSRVYNNIFDDCDRKFDSIRPKSLKGIENNNGWIKIESEADLPKENGFYWTSENTPQANFRIAIREFKSNSKGFCFMGIKQFITHYQPIEKPKPPIY